MRLGLPVLAGRIGLIVFATWGSGTATQADEFFFKDGDTVVMMGDSITEQHLYSNYVEMWTVSRFPQWKLTFRNAGIGGDRSVGGNARFARDVLVHKATAMTVDFGMNDGGYRAFDEAGFKTYMGGLQGIAKQARAANMRVAWLTPSPVEKAETGPALEGYNQTLEKYSAGVQDVAASSGGLFVDQFHPFVAAQDKARAADAKNRIGGGDPVHPGAPGQALMAWAILKGLHFPSLVSSVAVDAANSKVATAENCQVTDLSAAADGVRFQRLDAALPFFPAEAEKIQAWVPIRDELNQYGLKVSGLKAGNYQVRLGGKTVASYSADELAAGVNLAPAALAQGPVSDQVKRVWGALVAKNRYFHDQIYRGIVLAQINVPDYLGVKISPAEMQAKRESALAERMAKMPELDQAVREALEMRPHQVEIVAVP
jgi:lysophospholipase L1-like esterase